MPDFNQMQRRRLAAKRQAMPDGGFPIRNVADLKNAIQAFGRAKNKPAVKAWIKKRARELGATDLLPDNWRDVTLVHYGIKGQKWGIRRFQNEDGTLTAKGKARSNKDSKRDSKTAKEKARSNKDSKRDSKKSSISDKINSGKKAAINGIKKYGPVVAKSAAITALAAVGVPTVVLSVANYVAFGQTPLRTLGLDSDYDSKYSSMRGVSLSPIEIEDN